MKNLRPHSTSRLLRHDPAECRIPRYALAVVRGLRFDQDGQGALAELKEDELNSALSFCDREQLTLILLQRCGQVLPEWAQARIESNLREYTPRFERLKQSLFEISETFKTSGIEFVVLKGLAHSPHFTPDPILRAQGDIDLWCGDGQVAAARDKLIELGYSPFGDSQGRHLPPFVSESNWVWRGNYWASDLPVSVDLHYQLWDEKFEAIPSPDERQLWERRTTVRIDGQELPVLLKPDALAFACLHLLMHILHGDMKLQRGWEIAHFLHTHASNAAFWSLWMKCHEEGLRRLEAIVFQLVSDWFGADLSETAEGEIDRLPVEVKLWIQHCGFSPLEAPFRPNKDELWLHLSLVDRPAQRRKIWLRRLLPLKAAMRIGAAALSDRRKTPPLWNIRLRRLKERLAHHCRVLPDVLLGSLRWKWTVHGPAPGFLWYLGASVLFCMGVFIFLLLYNLYLRALGFREDLMGRVAGAMSIGTAAGAVCAPVLTRWCGLRNVILAAAGGCAAASGLRSLSATEFPLLATAGIHGLFLALWTVSFSPAIAGFTRESNRQFAFGLACATGVASGIVAGVVGGRLPLVMEELGASAEKAMKIALWSASGLILLAAVPLARLRLAAEPQADDRLYPRGKFITAFVIWLALWCCAVGSFNPFFNAFLANQAQMNVERIGFAFSLSHFGQVLALLAAPFVLKRAGVVRGVAAMQLCAALTLILLAFSRGPAIATAAYVCFMSLQYMNEPGVFSMLMGRVAPGERSGASALYGLVASLCGSAAAVAAGIVILRFGYPSALTVSAVLATLSAFVFRLLMKEQTPRSTSLTSH